MEHPLILRLDVTGYPLSWINHEQCAAFATRGMIAWTASADHFMLRGGTSRLTGEQSTLELNTIIATQGVHRARGNNHTNNISLTNPMLFRRDNNMCAYCGDYFPTTKLTRDHIHPTSKGGANTWMNVVTSCGFCNTRKCNKTLEQCGMKLLYIPYVPVISEYLVLQNRKILADQMEVLMNFIPKSSRIIKNRLTSNNL